MLTLIIDCSLKDKITVGIKKGKKIWFKTCQPGGQKAQIILSLISEFLNEKKLSVKDLDAVEVSKESISFTSLRVGMAIGNALSFALKIPVNGQKIGKFARPIYPKLNLYKNTKQNK